MERIIEKPGLPENKVSSVVISDGLKKIIYDKLESLSVNVIKTTCCTNVRSGISNHADVSFCHLWQENCLIDNSQKELYAILKRKGFNPHFLINDYKDVYPYDVQLNCVFMNKFLICNSRTVSEHIIKYAKENDYLIINVNQGYTKCSIALVGDNALITDDHAIGCRAKEFGIDALIIDKGEIQLKNYNYGFIGGCCGKVAEDKLAVNGNFKYLKSGREIESFLFSHNVEPIYLDDSLPEDIGSIIPITEFFL